MPSRRAALAALGTATTLSLAGCLDVTHAPGPYCQLKAVMVEWTHDGQRYRDDVGRTAGYPAIDGDDGEARGFVAAELPPLASGPRDLTVDEDTASLLERRFDTVDYLLGFCGDAFDPCRNTRVASREGFNRVQVGDRARVTLSDHTFHVHSVDGADPRAVADWETEFSTYDFSEIHEEHGEPLGER